MFGRLTVTLGKTLVALILLAPALGAQVSGVKTLGAYKAHVARLLNLDTVSYGGMISSAELGTLIFRSVDNLPSSALGRERTKTVVTSVGTRQYFVDSLIAQVSALWKLDNDSVAIVKQIPMGQWNDKLGVGRWLDSAGYNSYGPLFFWFMSDSLWVYPTPKAIDTLRVFYYQTPVFGAGTVSDTSTLIIRRGYDMGVILYTCYLLSLRISVEPEKQALFWLAQYKEWVEQTKANIVGRPRDE